MLIGFLNLYPFVKISGGLRATVNVKLTAAFIVALTSVYT